ncbi:MAG: Wzz/FepE/Etk N-terminal domain-containing protein [bacterium]
MDEGREERGREREVIREPYYGPDPSDEISLIELINVVLKNRRMVAVTPLVIFMLVVAYAFLQPRTYTSSASFTPQSSSGSRSMTASLAAQFGVSVPGSENAQSPQFYANLITSREILSPLIDSTFTFRADEERFSGTPAGLFEIEGDSPGRVREVTLRALKNRISVSTDRETGLVSVSVQTLWPEFSRHLADSILEQLNRFNLETRQSQASAERAFVERRLAVVRDSLRAAEDALQDFLQRNRQIDSPQLQFIHDRLQRRVSMQQQVYTTLSQSYEQSSIDEVRDTPVITVVEQPESPAIPDRRRLLLKGILALMVGGMLGVFGSFGREFMIRGRDTDSDEFEEFDRLKQATFQDLKRPWRFITG